jgi:hypothetical protein
MQAPQGLTFLLPTTNLPIHSVQPALYICVKIYI